MTMASDSGIEVPRWSLRLFGAFDLSRHPGRESINGLGKRERVVLAVLALSPNCRVPRRKLATLLWGDAADEAATDNLRVCIFNLRKALGESGRDAIVSDGKDLVLDRAAFAVDALEFRALVRADNRAGLEAAASLYTGDFLDGVEIKNEEYESWRREERARFRDQMVDVLARLTGQLADAGESDAAVEAGTRLLRLDPLHESAVRRMMRVYGESGRRGAAVQLYRSFADTLKRELGAEPEAETQAVLAVISRGAETAEVPGSEVLPLVKAVGHRPQQVKSMAAAPTAVSTEPLRRRRSRKLRWIVGGALAATTLVLLVLYQVIPWDGKGADGSSPISIAVLPFVNLSGDKGQEFFSDGVTEEIIAALAKVPALRVVARTSVFQFKGENVNVEEILRQLHASYAIQGSVRRDGDKLRVTAQLADASGTTRWSESYDRQFADIIATQEDIARAVAAALRVPLGLKPGESLVSGTQNLSTYQAYLQAKAWLRNRNNPSQPHGPFLETLESIVTRDPGFAPAWAVLSRAYLTQIQGSDALPLGTIEEARDVVRTLQPKSETAGTKALELDPSHADAYAAMAELKSHLGQWIAAEDFLKRGLAVDANDPDLLLTYSDLLLWTGRVKEARNVSEKLRDLEPLVPVYHTRAATMLMMTGQYDAALAAFEAIPPKSRGAAWYTGVQRTQAAAGHYDEVANSITNALAIRGFIPPRSRQGFEDAATIIRSAPKKADPKSLPSSLGHGEGVLFFVYAHVGALDRVFDYPEREAKIGYLDDWGKTLWAPDMGAVRRTERFKGLVRTSGLVDYWRARGWPEFCRPTIGDDFACN